MKRLAYWCLAAVAAAAVGLVLPSPGWADSIRDQQWQLAFLRLAEAHRYSTGAGVVVAVVDSGVDGSHPDLAGNVLPGGDVSSSGGADGQTDVTGHGTAMAGLIAAHGHGSGQTQGTLGIAPQATLLPVKDGDAHTFAIADAIEWATMHGAKVISISQGGNVDPSERRAVEDALSHDIVVVAAVGNTSAGFVQYPAAFPGVIAVAGVDQQGNHASFSITGPQVTISAPAVDIPEPGLGHGYIRGSGTSDATAIVSGVAALVRAKYPNMPATEVVHRLTATATDKGTPGRDNEYGYGIVNPVAALTADVPPLQTETPSAAPTSATAQPDRKGTDPRIYIAIGVTLAILATTGLLIATRRNRRG